LLFWDNELLYWAKTLRRHPKRTELQMLNNPSPSNGTVHTPRPLIRSATLSGYMELVTSLGRDPLMFLQAVGLSPKLLENSETLVPRDAARELLEITARATKVEDFALRLAARRRLSALGPISLVLKEEPTPRHALNTLCRYLKLVNPSLILNVEDAGGTVIIREGLLPSPGLAMRQSVELAVGTMYRMLSDLAGEQWRPREVCFSHRPTADLSAYRAFFGATIKFNQEFDGLVCDAMELDKPRASGDQLAANYARKFLETALTHRKASTQDSCYQMILAVLPGGGCSAQEVARLMGVDRRTLHRHLEAEGLSYSQLLDLVRSDLVKRHLRESDLPLNEVAELLGFSRPSSLSHWFQAKFSCTASQWRLQNKPMAS
jgi:AraC-like DNA-binding protein